MAVGFIAGRSSAGENNTDDRAVIKLITDSFCSICLRDWLTHIESCCLHHAVAALVSEALGDQLEVIDGDTPTAPYGASLN